MFLYIRTWLKKAYSIYHNVTSLELESNIFTYKKKIPLVPSHPWFKPLTRKSLLRPLSWQGADDCKCG